MPPVRAVVGWKPSSRDHRVASARLRCHIPLALLQSSGYPVELYREENARHYDVVVLQKLYDPKHQELARRFQAQGTRVVFDLCDNHLYDTDQDITLTARADQVRRMLGIADAVTVPTEALADHLPRSASVIRDGVEPCPPTGLLRSLLTRRRGHSRLELLWFGTWGDPRVPFGMHDLLGIREALQEFAARTPVRLTVVSNSRRAFREWIAPLALPTRYVEWKNHAHLCRLLPLHDACVLPIQVNPYTVCKSPNRLTLSLSLGVPVIATSIPSYEEFAPFCTLDDWGGGLQGVGGMEQSRMTEAGQAHVLKHHTAERAAEEWRRVLDGLLSRETVGAAAGRRRV